MSEDYKHLSQVDDLEDTDISTDESDLMDDEDLETGTKGGSVNRSQGDLDEMEPESSNDDSDLVDSQEYQELNDEEF